MNDTLIGVLLIVGVLIVTTGFVVEICGAAISISQGNDYYTLTKANIMKDGKIALVLSSIMIIVAICAIIATLATEGKGMYFSWIVTIPLGVTWFCYVIYQMKNLTKNACNAQENRFVAYMKNFWHQTRPALYYQRKLAIFDLFSKLLQKIIYLFNCQLLF